ncbi:MAG: sulfite exporter TauE/SafE family protein, partial [Deltaproteobacteria bacterium]|nr:sulfite exporter TauE/SafE family protein [Deltaproteobacteria bacterium]
YNCGRITTYAFLGGIMGVTGSFTVVTTNIACIQKSVMIFTGLLVIIMGLGMSGLIRVGRIFRDFYNPKNIIAKGFQALSSSGSTFAFFPLGLLLGLLPCGPVYTALIAAARAGMEAKSPLESFFMGLGLMFAFGLGTVPSLMIIAKLTDMKWLKSREIIYKAGAILMVIVGLYFVIKGIQY